MVQAHTRYFSYYVFSCIRKGTMLQQISQCDKDMLRCQTTRFILKDEALSFVSLKLCEGHCLVEKEVIHLTLLNTGDAIEW